jgi:chorismate mutase/prephenate dehydratase
MNSKHRDAKDADKAGSDGANTLEELRLDIDRLDAELLAALNRRARLSLEVGRLKCGSGDPVFRPEREAALLDKLLRGNSGPMPGEHLLAVYREILASSRALQRPQRVAYLGPEGTFSHMAAQEYLGQTGEFVPLPGLSAVFDAVQKRQCDLGVVPIENSLNGTVGQSLDAFAGHEVFVLAEWFSRISLSLLSREENLRGINTVYSHPQPLGQCTAWLCANLPHAALVSLSSTAAAGQKAAGEPGVAAIGDARLASRLGLNVLAGNIEDLSDNWTRFFIIGPEPEKAAGADKTSITFGLSDQPGSLAKVLDALARAGVNMSKLESRPMRGERWKYIFFADLDCDINEPEYARVFKEVAGHCLFARLLGTYPAGRNIHALL